MGDRIIFYNRLSVQSALKLGDRILFCRMHINIRSEEDFGRQDFNFSASILRESCATRCYVFFSFCLEFKDPVNQITVVCLPIF